MIALFFVDKIKLEMKAGDGTKASTYDGVE